MDANNDDNLLRSQEEERMRALELEKRNRVTDEHLTDIWTEAVNLEVTYSDDEDWIDSERDNEIKIQTDEKQQDLESELEESIDKELSHGEHSDIENKLAEKEVERSPTSMAEQSGKSSVQDEENMASQTLPPRQDKLTDSVDGDPFCEKQEYSDYDGGTESEKLNNEGKIQKGEEIQTEEDIDHKSEEDSIVEELSQDDQSDIDIEAVHLVEVESNISSFTNMRKPAACAAVHEDQSGQQSAKPKDMAKGQKDGDMKAEILRVEEQGKRVQENSQKHKTKQEQETMELNIGRERMEEEIKMMDAEHDKANMSRRLEEKSMSALEEEEEKRRVEEEVETEMVKGHPSPAEKLESDDKVLRVPEECEKEGKKGRNKGKEILTEDKEPMMKPEKTAHASSENILLKSPLQGDHLSPIVEKVTSKPLPPLQDMCKHQLDDGSNAAMDEECMRKQKKKAKDTRKRNIQAEKRKYNEVKRLEMDRDATEKEKEKMVEEKKKAELIRKLEEERLKALAEVTETDKAKEQKDGDMKAEILRVEEQGKRVQENSQKHNTEQEQETMKLNMGRERMEEEIKMMDAEHDKANMSRRLEEKSMSALEEEEEKRRVEEEVETEMVKGHPSPAEKLESDDKVLRVPEECEKEGKKGRNKDKEILTEDKEPMMKPEKTAHASSENILLKSPLQGDHLSPIVEKVTSKPLAPLQDMCKHQLDDGSNAAMDEECMRKQKKKAKDTRKRNIQAEKRKYNEVKRLEMDRDTTEKEKEKMVEEKKKAELIRRLEEERLKALAQVTETDKAKEQKDGDMKADILRVEEQGKRVQENSQKHKTKQEQETMKLNMGRERMEEEIKMMDAEHDKANMSRRLEEKSMSALEEEEERRRRVKKEVETEMVKGHPSPAEKLESDDKVLRDPAECEKEGKKGRNKGKKILTEDKEPMMKPEKTAHANSENVLLKSPLQGDHLSPIVEKVTSKPLAPLQDVCKHQLDDGSNAAMDAECMRKQKKKAKDTRKRNIQAEKRKYNEVKRLEMDRDTTEKEKEKMVEEKKKAELIRRLEEERLKALAQVKETLKAKKAIRM
ncbi:golgin subfamily A member 6-like protein 22 [Clupea harengus]|uniref:Golgin subfamily A member 6-like protein 22 n=1 Tax=Clupea harengus TaxID=7950 RepID=A0A8M1K5I9_CLUHA|nr:golgin subfamily A member 6-like protein 22 [Clupea harengus]